MTLADTLATRSDRCSLGFAAVHHPHLCHCKELGDYAVFLRALDQAKRDDGTVHVNDVRPLVIDRIKPPQKIAQCWQRARAEHVIAGIPGPAGWEDSTDLASRNRDKLARVYRMSAAA